MMAVTIKQIEGPADDYPTPPEGLSTAAAALEPALIWQRLEAWIAWRWSVRDAEWIVEGCGEWAPPLTPVTIATTERWAGEAWEAVELPPSPLGGYVLPGVGPYRFAGTAGADDDVPVAVLEAYRRLAEHTAAISYEGAGLRSENVPDIWQGEYDQRARARALQDSGAADLLRTYRRA